ncbi:hypothetical protein ACWD3I_48770 [Streptomyces sp. NPDC002817]|uniref:hypothetical protein n=1 Tax=Streptomyces sp. NPDC088357 TaxID=3154655 RepID=UPI003418953A
MGTGGASAGEIAVLDGGPADGMKVRVTDRPRLIQVTSPCEVEDPADGTRVEALYLYRRVHGVSDEPLRYSFDVTSP